MSVTTRTEADSDGSCWEVTTRDGVVTRRLLPWGPQGAPSQEGALGALVVRSFVVIVVVLVALGLVMLGRVLAQWHMGGR